MALQSLVLWRLGKDRYVVSVWEERFTRRNRDDAAVGQWLGSPHVVTLAGEPSGRIEPAVRMEQRQPRAGAAGDGSKAAEHEDSAVRHLSGSIDRTSELSGGESRIEGTV